MLPVVEIFGPTIQGEGEDIGRQTMFLRLAGCDFRCEWCDTKYAIQNVPITKMDRNTILEKLYQLSDYCKTLVISGGNPCIHDLTELISLLNMEGYKINIETQGSVFKPWLLDVDGVNISPKPPSSGIRLSQSINMLHDFMHQALPVPNKRLKVVVFDDRDLEFAVNIHKQYPMFPFTLQAGTPQVNFTTPELRNELLERLKRLIQEAVRSELFGSDVRILPQLHTLIWGCRRGV